jgi:hypothetical protein
MKHLLIALLLVISLPTWANEVGLGVSLGNPTGLNGKYWLDGEHAVDAGVGWSFGDNTNFSIHSDYLWHSEGAFFFNDVHALDLYYGVGGRMEFADDIDLGLRVPVGLVHRVEDKSADIFGEIAPVFDFIGAKGIDLHVLVGGRYYF